MTEFFHTLMNTNPVHIFLAVGAVLAVCGGGAAGSAEEDDNSDYENASWNPSSVNYNG